MTESPPAAPEDAFRAPPRGATGTFGKQDRLVRTGEFKRVYHRGFHASSERFGCYVLRRRGPRSRLGISVSKKFGDAHLRNRIKRRVREAFRRIRWSFPGPVDIVIVPRRPARDADFACVAREMATLVAAALAARRRRR